MGETPYKYMDGWQLASFLRLQQALCSHVLTQGGAIPWGGELLSGFCVCVCARLKSPVGTYVPYIVRSGLFRGPCGGPLQLG